MKVYSVGYRSKAEGNPDFIIWKTPSWVHLIHMTIDKLCALTRHRFCSSRLMLWGIRLSDKHSETFEVPTTKELIQKYNVWRGWDFSDLDEDDEE